jgi:transaldolase
MTLLESLKKYTTVVADTGDIDAIAVYHNEDAMATEKLAEGIRKFNSDARKLEVYALSHVAEKVGLEVGR